MIGPKRKTVGGPRVGLPAQRGPITRECLKCPAAAHAKCLRWVAETWRDGGEVQRGAGRWEHLQGFHLVRQSPGSALSAELIRAGSVQCGRTDQHGYHWTNEERTAWCRGRTRT